MDPRLRVIRTIADAEELRVKLLDGACRTAAWLRACDAEPMAFLRKLRFEMIGHDPLTGEPLNIVEQLNHTFTILVALKAVEQLIDLHPNAGGFRLALGTCKGRDIESIQPGIVAAEVFSATRPSSNQKLRKDIGRLANDTARFRYVFFSAPLFPAGRQPLLEIEGSGVKVYSIQP